MAVFATALVMLAGFFIYIYQRRKLRAVNSRARRGKGFSGLQQPISDADMVYDDGRRGARGGPRRTLPWPLNLFSSWQRAPLFPDAQRAGFSFGLDLDRLWNGVGPAVVEATVDDLADVLPYTDGGRPSTSGPRFMATTASGKSLQVVVKTAAVSARQQQPDRQTALLSLHDSPPPPQTRSSWLDPVSSGRQLPPSASQGAITTTTSLPRTPTLSDGSAGSDFSDGGGATTSFSAGVNTGAPPTGAGRGPTLRAAAAAGGAAAGAQFGAARSGSDGPAASIARRESGTGGAVADAGAAAALDASDDDGFAVFPRSATGGRQAAYGDVLAGGIGAAVTPSPTGAAAGAAAVAAQPAQTNGAGYGGAGTPVVAAGGGNFLRASEVDPAAAWYSRALHRQVSAAATVTQASVPAPKVHLA